MPLTIKINHSTSVISQVRKADPVPATSLNATNQLCFSQLGREWVFPQCLFQKPSRFLPFHLAVLSCDSSFFSGPFLIRLLLVSLMYLPFWNGDMNLLYRKETIKLRLHNRSKVVARSLLPYR